MIRMARGAGLVAMAAAATLFALSAQGQQEPLYYPHQHMWDSGWGMVFGPLAMLLFAVAVVVAIILLIRWLSGPSHQPHLPGQHSAPGRAPLDILKERFARGEIDKAEFEERRRILEQ